MPTFNFVYSFPCTIRAEHNRPWNPPFSATRCVAIVSKKIQKKISCDVDEASKIPPVFNVTWLLIFEQIKANAPETEANGYRVSRTFSRIFHFVQQAYRSIWMGRNDISLTPTLTSQSGGAVCNKGRIEAGWSERTRMIQMNSVYRDFNERISAGIM